jgi:hypothetical protein
MDDRYHRQNVEIILNREGEAYKELVARAEAKGVPVETMVDSLVSLFIERHIKENLRFHEMMEAKNNK